MKREGEAVKRGHKAGLDLERMTELELWRLLSDGERLFQNGQAGWEEKGQGKLGVGLRLATWPAVAACCGHLLKACGGGDGPGGLQIWWAHFSTCMWPLYSAVSLHQQEWHSSHHGAA